MSATESPAELLDRLARERTAPPPPHVYRLAVACGRDHHPTALEKAALLALLDHHQATELHHGGAKGDIRFAEAAVAHNPALRVIIHPADWTAYGRSAGPIRTREMLAHVQALAHAQGGRGTAFAIEEAHRQGREVFSLQALAQARAAALEADFIL